MTSSSPSPTEEAAIWHDVECGAYAADLALWEELAAAASPDRRAGARVLDVGAGTGRVALHLAGRGHRVFALDHDESLLDALRGRIGGNDVTPLHADARGFEVTGSFDLVVAAMQLVHLLDGDERRSMLSCFASHLAPGGLAAISVMTVTPRPWRAGNGGAAPRPDVRERDSWVFSSLPLSIEAREDGITVRRLRQVVAPNGDLSEHVHAVALARLSARQVESEARTAGLVPRERRPVAETDDYVGSTVLVFEAPR